MKKLDLINDILETSDTIEDIMDRLRSLNSSGIISDDEYNDIIAVI